MIDDILEILVEFLLEIVVDSGVDAVSSKKRSSWGKLIIAILAAIICFVIIIGIIIFGFMTLDESVIGGAMIIIVGVFLLIAAVKNFVINLIIKLIQKSNEMKE